MRCAEKEDFHLIGTGRKDLNDEIGVVYAAASSSVIRSALSAAKSGNGEDRQAKIVLHIGKLFTVLLLLRFRDI